MARRPRIDLPGYHHIINRGVNRSDIFSADEDKESYFDKSMSRDHRNRAIYEAYRGGHTQKSISQELGLSDAMVSIIIKGFSS